MAGQGTYTAFWRGPLWTRLLSAAAVLLLITGIIGFAGPIAFGSKLPNSFEWPVGRADGVIAMPNGYHVVPVSAASRVQVYDSNWRFVRGWYIESGGRRLYLVPSQQDQFEVFTRSRGTHTNELHYVFTLNGELISGGTYFLDGRTFNSTIASQGKSVVVPTPIWLWIFTPIYSFLAVLCGVVMFGLINILNIAMRWSTTVTVTRRETWIRIETQQPPR